MNDRSLGELLELLDAPNTRDAAASELLRRARSMAESKWRREGDSFVEEVLATAVLKLIDRNRVKAVQNDGYLRRIVRNLGIDLKRQRRRAHSNEPVEEPSDDGELAPLEQAGPLVHEALDGLLATADALGLLSDARRAAVWELVELELGETTTEELANRLPAGATDESAKQRLNRLYQRHSRVRRHVLLPAHLQHLAEGREHPLEAALLKRLSVTAREDVQ
jgi:DNA-directed RNA polymerase specialized sigma24 family protein